MYSFIIHLFIILNNKYLNIKINNASYLFKGLRNIIKDKISFIQLLGEGAFGRG